MQEHSVTRRGHVYQLEPPFFVMATQNPIEQEGTYPLPEAQLDRFFFKLVVGYSNRDELTTILDRTTTGINVQARQGDGRRRDHRVAELVREVILPRTCRITSCGSRSPRIPRPVRRPITNQYVRWGSSPAAPGDHPGRQGPRHARRPLQRQLRRRPPSLPARPAHRVILNFEAEAEGIDARTTSCWRFWRSCPKRPRCPNPRESR